MDHQQHQPSPSQTQNGPAVPSGGDHGNAVAQQNIFLLVQPSPPLQYAFPSIATATASPLQQRREATSQQPVNTGSGNISTSSNTKFKHGAQYLQNLYPYYYPNHGIWKQKPQLYCPIINPSSYAMATAAALKKKRKLRVEDRNKIRHVNNNHNTNHAAYSNGLMSTSTRISSQQSLATINISDDSSSSSSSLGSGLDSGPSGGNVHSANMSGDDKRKRDDTKDQMEMKETETEIDLELRL